MFFYSFLILAAASKNVPVVKNTIPIASKPIVGVIPPAWGREEGVGAGVRMVEPAAEEADLTLISAPAD